MNAIGGGQPRPRVLILLHACGITALRDATPWLANLNGNVVLAYCRRIKRSEADTALGESLLLLESGKSAGNDMADFVDALATVDIGAYDIVCKLIAGQHAGDQSQWQSKMKRLFGDPSIEQRMSRLLSAGSSIGVVAAPSDGVHEGSDASAAETEAEQSIRNCLRLTQERRHADPSAFEMFWAKPLALTRLWQAARTNSLGQHMSSAEAKNAMLCLVPSAVNAVGYEIHWLREIDPAVTIQVGDRTIKLIAFYLPQFHPIPENDQWWGKGFTEWAQVTKARPLYDGHAQPRLPAELGYYDLRVLETREAQATLAREHGIHGFCYYYYWFNGRRILDRPLSEVVSSGRPDFPFCICWANENWTRRWDGLADQILLEQEYSMDGARLFIRDVMPMLRDKRYIRFEGKPVLLVYRVREVPNIGEVLELWRRECRAAGVGEIHIAGVRFWDLIDVTPLGFDAAVDFPPHHVAVRKLNGFVDGLTPDFDGLIYDYGHVVEQNLVRYSHGYAEPSHRGVMLAWDNTPRRGPSAHIAHGATPDLYREWLRGVIEQEAQFNLANESLIFINAWNEWAEGANLEPDSMFGRGFLEATRDAVRPQQVGLGSTQQAVDVR